MTTKLNQMLRQILWIAWIFCLGIILLFGSEVFPVQAQGGVGSDQSPLLLEKPKGKLSYRLELLAQPSIAGQDAETQAKTLSLPVSGPGSLLKNAQGELLVYIRLDNISESNLDALTNTGAQIIHVAEAYSAVTAYVSPGQLNAVAAIDGVDGVREGLTPVTSGVFWNQQEGVGATLTRPHRQIDCPGATTSEGDAQLNADDARATFGLDGSGVTVGVLSDSYNKDNTAGTNAVQDIASGDLPGVGNPCGRTTPINIIKEAVTGSDTIDEGRAMLQIIHDLSPGADLAFATAFAGLFDFADQIRALRNSAGADIIVDDVAYLEEPFFQDGPVSVAIQDVTADGALYFTSAGNAHAKDGSGNAITSYEAAAYRPTSCPVIFLSGQPGLPGVDCHDFNPTAGVDAKYSFTLVAGGSFTLIFQWAEPWNGTQTDFDIFLVDAANNILALGVNDNIGISQTPYEAIGYQNSTGSAQTVDLIIGRYQGAATPRIKHILIGSLGLIAVEYNASNSADSFGPTVFGHAGEDTAFSIAAVPYNDANSPEIFTSRGFPTYYFNPVVGTTPAAALSTPDTRQKPDVAATDGGRNTFFGTDFGGDIFRFFGTSAAAPHAAAVAALMKEQANKLTFPLDRATTELTLKRNAATIANGTSQATGSGLVDALASVRDLGVEVTSFPDPSPIEATTTTITYTINIKNKSNAPATGVIITNTIPGKTTYALNSASNGGIETSSGVIVWPATTIPATSNIVRTFQVDVTETITNGDQLVNFISVTSHEGIKIINLAKTNLVGEKRVYLPIIKK